MSNTPAVSCIMPTRDRRRFAAQAVHYFLQQDFESRELVVVDDGNDPIGDLIPEDPRLRYLRRTSRMKVGAKRNLACAQARGEIIVHWDDDDWMAPWRLTYQVGELRKNGGELCGLSELYFFDPRAGHAWRYVYPRGQKRWVAGGTLCYTKDLWRSHPFPGIDEGEDTRFVWGMDASRIVELPSLDFYAALVHDGNTSPKRIRKPRWQSCPLTRVQKLMGSDWAFYGGLVAGEAKAPVPIAVAPQKKRPARDVRPPQPSASDRQGVTVSIPYHGCSQTLRRAVESVLAQTHDSLTVVVLNDGDAAPWDLLADLQDPRLVCFDLEQNRGRYFADAVALEATTDPYFLVQDADDWSEKDRVESLLRKMRQEHAQGALSTQEIHHDVGQRHSSRIERPQGLHQPLDHQFLHRGDHHGLFKTEALRAIGGYYAGWRIGYDTLLVNLLLMTGRLAWVDRPLYHRSTRWDSLTVARSTGMRSTARRRATEAMRKMYAAAYGAYRRYLQGELDVEELRHKIRALRDSRVDATIRATLTREAQRLRQILQRPPARRSDVATVPLASFVEDRGLPWPEWSLGKTAARELLQRLEELRPRRILEMGSGTSTVVLAAYAERHDAYVVSLEHAKRFYDKTRALLVDHDLRHRVDLRLAPLVPTETTPGKTSPWYQTTLEGEFDFALIDGPPLRHGRQANLFVLAPHLSAPWEVWLDDAERPHEKRCVALWARHFEFDSKVERGIVRLRSRTPDEVGAQKPARSRRGPVKAALGITLLTGGRFHLLRKTVDALENSIPEVLQTNRVLVLVNGQDSQTREFVAALGFVDRCFQHEVRVLSTGEATSFLMKEIQNGPHVDHILHIEDDWILRHDGTDWVERSRKILEQHPEIGQVRLRHSKERVLLRHMITGRRISWSRHDHFLMSSSAHFTFNPSLIRAQDACRMFPCASEREAQQRFLQTRFFTAQLLPGVFCHLGDGQSRTVKEARRAS